MGLEDDSSSFLTFWGKQPGQEGFRGEFLLETTSGVKKNHKNQPGCQNHGRESPENCSLSAHLAGMFLQVDTVICHVSRITDYWCSIVLHDFAVLWIFNF